MYLLLPNYSTMETCIRDLRLEILEKDKERTKKNPSLLDRIQHYFRYVLGYMTFHMVPMHRSKNGRNMVAESARVVQ